MAILQLKFGNFLFGGKVEEWQEILDQKIETQSLINTNGVALNDPSFVAERQISIKGSIKGDTIDEVRSKLDSIREAMNQSGLQNLYLYDDRYVKAMKLQYADRPVLGSALFHWVFEATFISPSSLWISNNLSTSGTVSPTTSPEVILSLTNNGTAKAPIKVTISAPSGTDISGFTLKNITASPSQTLVYTGTVTKNNAVIIEEEAAETQRVLNNGTDDVKNLAGRFIDLLPGSNQIQYVGSVQANILIEWRDRYF